jgi:hypothetical protein
MPGTATCRRPLRCRRRGERSFLQPHATRRPARLASSDQLIACGEALSFPRLTGVPITRRLIADDRLAVALAECLLKLDIAVAEDWKKAECDPTSYIRITLERLIDAHGGADIRRRFLLAAAISNSPCDWAETDETQPDQLFLTVEPSESSCGCVVFGPTLQLLECINPRLPTSFFHLFVGALNRWTRVYDFRDAEDRAETLREWVAQEPDAGQYELPDVAGSIPPCMKQETLEGDDLLHVTNEIRDPLARRLIEGAVGLDQLSAHAVRPDISEDIGMLLSDCNPPLPSLVALFAESDPVAACLDEEAQGMMEVTPEPNLIVPFNPGDAKSVRSAFKVFGVACETLSAASRLMNLMPGNDKWIISR